MRQLITKAVAFGFGVTALMGSAWAAPAIATAEAMGQYGSLIVPAMDEETRAVEEDLRPDEVPETMEDKAAPKEPMAGTEERGGGNIEDEMIDKIGPGAE